ncbi:hypothetical protein CUROG_07955 [Corynebacterium urogenitale]|uniref:Uncharacterized protein n=1 Tax=Corynebacterium urogenitale TaxID=2487892 RepID=A0A5J6ZC30_9CORY|nr:hypothetical protein CUROG_07955 [Corynebacterium urogenitale]
MVAKWRAEPKMLVAARLLAQKGLVYLVLTLRTLIGYLDDSGMDVSAWLELSGIL